MVNHTPPSDIPKLGVNPAAHYHWSLVNHPSLADRTRLGVNPAAQFGSLKRNGC